MNSSDSFYSQGETSSSSDADESPARKSAQAPPARSQKRSTRLHNIHAGRMQIKAVKPADIALGLTESEGYQVNLKHKRSILI